MGNHLVKDENSNLMRSIATGDIRPADEFSKTFINAMYHQTDIDSNNKPFRLNVRRACCMGAVKVGETSQSLTENAISIKMPLVDSTNQKCPLNFKKQGDKYVLGSLSLTQENYDKLKLEDCLGYKNIAVLFDLTREQCKSADRINDPGDTRDFYFEKAKAGLTNENQSCQNWMKWHCSKSIYQQGCLSIKLDAKGNKVRAFDINHYGCGDYDENLNEFKNNVNPQFKECVCINDMNGYTFNNDPGILRGFNDVYGLPNNEKDSRNTESIYSLNLRHPKKAPADEVNPIESSEFCNSVMYNQNFERGVFQAFLNGKERVTQPQVKCINRIDIGTITAGNNVNMSGISQVNNCGNPAQEAKLKAEEEKLIKEATPPPPPAPPAVQAKQEAIADKGARTNDAKETAVVDQAQALLEQEKKKKEEEEKKLAEAQAKLKAQEEELKKKLEEIAAKEKKVEEAKKQIAEPSPAPVSNITSLPAETTTAPVSLPTTTTTTSGNLYLYLGIGGAFIILLVIVLLFTSGGKKSKRSRNDDDDEEDEED